MLTSDATLITDNQTLVSLSESCGSKEIRMHYLKYSTLAPEPDFRIYSLLKRPETIPEIDPGGLGIHGPYVLFNSKNKIIPLSSFKSAVSIAFETTPSIILLAPTPDIFNHLVATQSNYPVFHVCCDEQSYYFLRTLRTSYPNIPIVAVTDLNPHHLDLLTFLDTPPDEVIYCYGWDFIADSDEVDVIDFVNIQWLGLCPNDCEALDFDYDANRAAPLPGFDEVIHVLRANPYLRRKIDWLAVLDWLDLFRVSVSFLSGGDFISKKLANNDWV